MSPRLPGQLSLPEQLLLIIRRSPGLTSNALAARVGQPRRRTSTRLEELEADGKITKIIITDPENPDVGRYGYRVV